MQHASSFNTLEITSDSLSIFLFVLIAKRTINVLAINNCQWVVHVCTEYTWSIQKLTVWQIYNNTSLTTLYWVFNFPCMCLLKSKFYITNFHLIEITCLL